VLCLIGLMKVASSTSLFMLSYSGYFVKQGYEAIAWIFSLPCLIKIDGPFFVPTDSYRSSESRIFL